MKRLAYIISAYQDAAQLARTIHALDWNADFYVHIDAKVDAAPFLEKLQGKATFVKRHWVSWGGWQQVEYQKELLKAAIESGKDYSHVICLSGTDYPLWSNRRIHDFFQSQPETEFMAGTDITHGNDKRQISKIRIYHFFRDLPWRNQFIKDKFIVSSRWLMKILPFHKKTTVKIHEKPADIYFGSDYFALTLPCAKYVYQTLCENPKLVGYFKTAFVPSELCIQTIVFNSPFGKQAEKRCFDRNVSLFDVTPLHYINYKKSMTIVQEQDFEDICIADKMFFRKVSTEKSEKLMDRIDELRNLD